MTLPTVGPDSGDANVNADADASVVASVVCVVFDLAVEDGWPPAPAETLSAVLVAPDVAEIIGIPLYVDRVSVGDRVRVETVDGVRRGGPVVRPGRHSTVRVVSSSAEELAELAELAGSMGLATAAGAPPSMLVIDVPDVVAIEDLLVPLDFRCSLTLTYTISCLRHRITPLGLGDAPHHRPLPVDQPDGSELEEQLLALDLELRGRLVRPGDEAWDASRSAWNLAVDQHPALVVEAADPFDVQAVIRFAARVGLKVAPQSTGHGAAPLGDLSDAVLLRTGRMAAVQVDPERRSVRVGAGARWGQVSAALAPHGLAALAGSSGDVGVAGHALGGGYSWLGRRHGLASSSVTAVELVTGDGVFHRVEAGCEPDLFWAVRGAGANVGVVCTLELDVQPIPTVYAGALFYPLGRAAELLAAYAAWARELDDRATTCARMSRRPQPGGPDALAGNGCFMIDGAIDAPATDAERLLAPLRALGPVVDTFGPVDSSQLSTIHLDPPGPVALTGDGVALADLTPEVMAAIVAHAGNGRDGPSLTVDIRQLGGALSRRDPRGGIIDHLPGRFLLFAAGRTPEPDSVVAVRAAVTALMTAVQPWAAALDYPNFREVGVDPGRLFAAADLAALRSLRHAHDPAGLLRAGHPVA